MSEQPPSYPPPPPPPPGPPPPPPPPGGYGQQPYGYVQGPQNSGKAVAIMVLGIVALVFICAYGVGVVLAIVALALAPGAKREIRESGGRLGGESFIKAGVICSWVAVGIGIAVLTLIAVFVILGIVTNTTTTHSFDSSNSVQSCLVWLRP